MRQSHVQARLIDLSNLIVGESTNTDFLNYLSEFDELSELEDVLIADTIDIEDI